MTRPTLIVNAFSFNMIAATEAELAMCEVSRSEAAELANREGVESAVGHADTASVFSTLLGREVAFRRTDVALKKGDMVLLGQYSGPRLPEGAVTLPEGATVRWMIVWVKL